MNLQKFFTAQAELDAYIEQQHPVVEGENRLEKKLLALNVELGECANEWRGFKFWSNNQSARNYCKLCHLIETPHECNNPLLEEYVDCLHFILSIGNDLRYFDIEYAEKHPYQSDETLTINELFSSVFRKVTEINGNQHQKTIGLYSTIWSFEKLGFALGFTDEQIEQAYWKKYEINKQRQVEGY